MAAATAAVGSRNLGPTYGAERSSEQNSDEWNFSVPDPLGTQQSNANSHTANSHMPQYSSYTVATHRYPPNESLPKPTDPAILDEIEREALNRISTPRSPKTAHNRNVDPAYLSPFKDGMRPGMSDSRSGSEPDSLLDLYGQRRVSGSKSLGGVSQDSRRDVHHQQAEPIQNEEDQEGSRWIHRDKLLLIESKEMQELGIVPPVPRPRATSRAKSRREPSPDQYVNGDLSPEPEVRSAKEGKRRRLQSPIRYENEVDEGGTLSNDFDIRPPEEIAADLQRSTSLMYRQQNLRSSSSRIPLPRSSPMPIPQGHIERHTPLPRKRGTSQGEEDITYPHSRSRNNSMSSQILLDETNYPLPSSPPTNSSRPPSQGSPTKPRNFSTNTSQASKPPTSTPTNSKPRTASSNTRSPSTPIRPRSRSGLEPRPPTAINRPEGDPPWLKEMYKPDPRLPPEQQLLPTHAKRLQQEQWEAARKESEARQRILGNKANSPQQRAREGDRALSPLAVHTRSGLQAPVQNNAGDGPPSPLDRQTHQDATGERRSSPNGVGGGDAWPLSKPPIPGKLGPQSPAARGHSPSGDAADEQPNAGLFSRVSPPSGGQLAPRLGKSAEQERTVFQPGSGGSGVREKERERVVDPFEKERLAREGKDRGERKEGKEGKGDEEGAGCRCCIVM